MEAQDIPPKFLQLLQQSTAKTGIKGVSKIGQARSRARRTFWAVVVIAGVGRSMLTL